MKKKTSLKIISLFLWCLTFICVVVFVSAARAGSIDTSGVTASTIMDRALRYLDAVDDPFYTEDDFIQWVDEAVRETVNRCGCLEQAEFEKTLVDGDNRYYVVDNIGSEYFLKVVAVEHDNGDTTDHQRIITLDRIGKNDVGHNDTKGRPRFYSIWNNYIDIWPIPDSNQAGTTINIYTVKLPDGVDNIYDTLETPAYFDVAILYYVVAQARYKNAQPDIGDKWMALYEKRVNEYTSVIVQRKPIE